MLRVQGRASLTTSPDVLKAFSDTSRPPKLVIDFAVESAYLHCAKAMMRSKLWSPDSRVERSVLPTMGEMIKEQAQLSEPAESQAEMLRRYADSL
jgi:predicted pyridoxine 5'-phosphate oxidase superfamily flavin-nucleotide-binding protein